MANYNVSDIVKNLAFNKDATDSIMAGVNKLADAVESTLGASGRCVIYEDNMGTPSVTKDGVTVANSVVLQDAMENMGASLIRQAAQNTVKEVGDATTTSIVLSRYLLKYLLESKAEIRDLKEGVENGLKKIVEYVDKTKVEVDDEKLHSVATISTNNDKKLGSIIANTFIEVGKNGVVLIEDSDTGDTYSEIVDGVSFDSGLTSKFFRTGDDRQVAELDRPLILLSTSPITTFRKIQKICEYCANNGRALLIIADVEQAALRPLIANKAKGLLKVNVVRPAGFANTKHDTMEDIAILTGGRVISEEIGDDMDLISLDDLGEAMKAVTDERSTTITTLDVGEDKIKERIESVEKLITEEKNAFTKSKLEQRLAMLSGKVGIIYVGGNSEVEMKEVKDRVDDAVHATKAALKDGIVAGGGVALRDASMVLDQTKAGEYELCKAIRMPITVIADNAGLYWGDDETDAAKEGWGLNAITGEMVDMVEANIIDPSLSIKTALKNAVSVATTIVSANCVISNVRDYEGNR